MAEVNTDSYLKPAALPQQKSLLDQVGQFQQLESGKNVIEKQKLDLVNQRFKELSKVIDLPLESSTSKLYLSPTKVGWYDVNTDNREIVMNYKEVDGTFYYESKLLRKARYIR